MDPNTIGDLVNAIAAVTEPEQYSPTEVWIQEVFASRAYFWLSPAGEVFLTGSPAWHWPLLYQEIPIPPDETRYQVVEAARRDLWDLGWRFGTHHDAWWNASRRVWVRGHGEPSLAVGEPSLSTAQRNSLIALGEAGQWRVSSVRCGVNGEVLYRPPGDTTPFGS